MMKAITKMLALTSSLYIICAVNVFAQDKAFKKEWTHLSGSLYYQSATIDKKMPYGATTLRLFGFDGKQSLPAEFLLRGSVIDADKAHGARMLSLQDATLQFTDSKGDKVSFAGYLRMAVSNAPDKRQDMTFWLGSGLLTINDNDYRLIEDGLNHIFWNTGTLTLSTARSIKGHPAIVANLDGLNLPRHLTVTSPTKANNLSDFLSGRRTDLKVTGSDLVHKVLRNPSRADISYFPGYTEHVTQYLYKDRKSVIRTTVDSISLGNVIHTPGFDASLRDDVLTVTMPVGEARYRGDKLEYAIWHTDEGTGTFSGDTLYRYDGSRLAGFSYEPGHTDDGYLVTRLTLMGALADPDIFDFTDAYRSSGLTVSKFISADGTEIEDVIGNMIPSVSEKEMLGRSHIGPDRTLADVKGRASRVRISSTETQGAENVYTFDREGYFTGQLTNYYNINDAFSNPLLIDLDWSDLGHNNISTLKIKNPEAGGLGMDLTVKRDGSGYIYEIGTTSSPKYQQTAGVTSYLWVNNHPIRSWVSGYEAEPTVYTYSLDGRLIRECYTSLDNGAEYVWEYSYGPSDAHGNWLERSVTFTFTPSDTDSAEPLSQTWSETRQIEYY